MHFILEPNLGANQLKFGMLREELRKTLASKPMTKIQEPENDFYENEGLILGYDNNEKLEFIEIIRPSSAEYDGIDFYSLKIDELISEFEKRGFITQLNDGGYNFDSVGIALFCPNGALESVSLYKKGYYDDL